MIIATFFIGMFFGFGVACILAMASRADEDFYQSDLTSAMDELLSLNQCEQEGLQSGMPSSQDWNKAFDRLERALENYRHEMSEL